MICPAFFDLLNDDVIVDNPTAIRVYIRLLRTPMMFVKPQEVKTTGLADAMGAHRDSVQAALDLLITRGYVIDQGRTFRGVRQLMLSLDRQPSCPPKSAYPTPSLPSGALS